MFESGTKISGRVEFVDTSTFAGFGEFEDLGI